MNDNPISNILMISLVIFCVIFFILLAVWLVLVLKMKNKNKETIEQDANMTPENNKVKKDVDYTKHSIFDFMEFDKIEDNMIIRKKGRQYIMVIECQGVNYDLMSGLEKNSVEQGFLQFLNTLRYPIQLYVQTRTVNLGSSINRYKEKINNIRNEYMQRQMEYNTMVNTGDYSSKQLNNAKFELVKIQNLYEYGLDIVNNTEKMNLNKNILKKHYYVILSYIPEESTNSGYDTEEIRSMAFSDLYTRSQALINSLSVCEVSGKVLNSEELAELLYIAYNRDESETYQLDKALKAGVEDLYSTAPDVLDKRMKAIDLEIETQANIKAREIATEAMLNQEKLRKAKRKEERMSQLIDELAKEVLDDNKDILGKDVVKDAKKLIDKNKSA